MTRLSQAELLQDLERLCGAPLERAILELLSRGKSGIRQVAQRLSEAPLAERISDALRNRDRQVVEMVASARMLGDRSGQAIVATLPSATLAAKISEWWQRNDLEEAGQLAQIAAELDPENPGVLEFSIRLCISGGDIGKAVSDLGFAVMRGADKSLVLLVADACIASGDPEKAYSVIMQYDPHLLLPEADRMLARSVYEMFVVGSLSPYHLESIEKQSLPRVISLCQSRGAEHLEQVAQSLSALVSEAMPGLEDLDFLAREAMSEAVPLRILAEDVEALARKSMSHIDKARTGISDALEQGSRWSSAVMPPIGETIQALRQMARELVLEPGERALQETARVFELLQCIVAMCEEALASNASRTVFARGLRDMVQEAMAITFDLVDYSAPVQVMHLLYSPAADIVLESVRRVAEIAKRRNIVIVPEIDREAPGLKVDRNLLVAALGGIIRKAALSEYPTGRVIVRATRSMAEDQFVISVSGAASYSGRGLLYPVKVLKALGFEIAECSQNQGSVFVSVPMDKQVDLWVNLPGYKELTEDTRQALRAADALLFSGNAPATALFLYEKALNIELGQAYGRLHVRHLVLSRALAYRDQIPEVSKEVSKVCAIDEREAARRLAELLDAIVKDRIQKEIRDWRSLAVLLAAFYNREAEGVASVLYRAGDLRSRASEDSGGAESVRQAVLAVLTAQREHRIRTAGVR